MFFSVLYKRTPCSLRSFPFFIKERGVLCVLSFFSVLYKRMRHSLRSFTFCIKEHGILCVLFGFGHTKIANLAKKKECKRTGSLANCRVHWQEPGSLARTCNVATDRLVYQDVRGLSATEPCRGFRIGGCTMPKDAGMC